MCRMLEQIIIGHRGAAGLAPENTLLSFQTALDLGVHMVELDVHETLDGHLICIHDSNVERTTNGAGTVSEMTLQELRSFDAGQGEKIPLLYEVLDLARNRMRVNIELKTLGVEKEVVNQITSRNMIDEVMVSSFLHGTLLAMKELNSQIKTGTLVADSMDDLISYTLELGSDAINPRFSIVSHELIDDAHRNCLQIYPWTVNGYSQMLMLLQMGVDGIITDFPNLGLEILKEYSSSRH
jgi:glycerophosphoryl diester phosphodiesterase